MSIGMSIGISIGMSIVVSKTQMWLIFGQLRVLLPSLFPLQQVHFISS